MFDDTDLSGYGIVAESQEAELFPPTPPEYGWLIKILTAEKQLTQEGAEASILITGCIESKSEWNGHRGTIRFFLTSKFPDSNPLKRLSAFSYALGLNGKISKTTEFVNRRAIVYFEVTPDGVYTRPKKWWQNTAENVGRIAVQPLPTWTRPPNGAKYGQKADQGNSVPF